MSSTLSDNVKAIGATAAVLTLGAGLLLASSSTPAKRHSYLIKDHQKVAKEVVNDGVSTKSEEEFLYDIVIIGGGTAGCAAASRLSEDPNLKVLLLEAGGSGVAVDFSRIPAAYGQLMLSKHDYHLYTIPQKNAEGKKKYWPRGKMLGGSSSMNAMMFHIGDPGDYNEWAEIMKGEPGAEQWRFSNFKEHFLKFEKYMPHDLFPNLDKSKRGASGPVRVGWHGNFSELVSKWLDTCKNIGIPLTPDFNTPAGTMGASRIMTYISPKKERVSAEAAYLTPDVLKRPNLTVATHAHVTRILFSDDKKRAIGVEFAADNKKRFRVRVNKEVVISAGSVHTPHILMLSGIGPAAELAKHKIPLVADLPGVGTHLMDHPVVFTCFKVLPGLTYNFMRARSIGENIKALSALAQYNLFGTGPLTTNVAEAAAFVNSNDPKLFPKDQFPNHIEDTASSPGGPDLELVGMPIAFTEHGFGPMPHTDCVNIGATVLRPTSLGTITLKSADPFDQPIIDANYLDTQHDIDVLVRGIRLMLRISQTAPFSSIVVHDKTGDPLIDTNTHNLSDKELNDIVRKRVETLYHPTSSARMAPLSQNGVVDGFLRVYGIPNLRIADCSVIPTIISGHTTAPALALGEKVADLIRHGNIAS